MKHKKNEKLAIKKETRNQKHHDDDDDGTEQEYQWEYKW